MGKQHLLLVDGDAKSLRVMEVSLKKAGFQVTTAVHGKDAVEKVQISVPDLVLADTKMPEMDGFDLCKALKSDERFGAIPFVFLTNQKSVEFKVRGLELGAEDYLTKPIYIKEIVTRVSMILQKAEKERIERRETRGGFAGSLSDMGIVDLVQTFEIGRKTGVLNLQSGRVTGILYFREGKVVDAELGRHRAEGAFYRMLNLPEGTFELQFVPVERPDVIEMSTQGLLMEGMRRLDEWGRMLEQIPPLETIFQLDYEQLADRLSEIPDEVNGLLRLFDGHRTLQSVVDDSNFDDLAAMGIVSKLYFEGLIREAPQTAAKPEAKPVQEWLKAPPAHAQVMAPVNDELAQAEPELPPAMTPASAPMALSPAVPGPIAAAPIPGPAPGVSPVEEAAPLPASLPQLTQAPLALPAIPDAPSDELRALPKQAEVVVFNPREPQPGPYAELAEQWSGTASVPSTPGRLVDEAKEKLLREWGSVDGDSAAAPSLWAGAHAWSPAVFSVPAPGDAPPRAQPAEGLLPEPVTKSERPPIFGGAAIEPGLPPPAAPELRAEELTPAMRPDRLGAESGRVETSEEITASVPPPPPPFEALTQSQAHPRRAALWGGLAGMLLVGAIGFVVAQRHHEDNPGNPPETAAAENAPEPQIVKRTHEDGTVGEPDEPENVEPLEPKPEVVAVPPEVVAVPPEVKPTPAIPTAQDPKPLVISRTPETKPLPTPKTTVTSVTPGTEPQPGVSARTLPPPRVSAEPDAQFSRLLAQARRSNQSENFRTASSQYRRALAMKPDSAEAKAGLGIALVNSTSNQGGYREAVKLLEDATRSEGRDARAWLALGMAYQFTAQKPKARDAYQRYLTLEPSGPASGEVRALLKELGE